MIKEYPYDNNEYIIINIDSSIEIYLNIFFCFNIKIFVLIIILYFIDID